MSALELQRVLGPASLQDLGRPGQLHLGLPRGGTLAPSTLAALNEGLGNPRHTPAIEVFGTLLARALGHVVVQLDGEVPRALAPGDTLAVRPEGRRLRLLAVAGGFVVPEVLGGRGLLPSAGLGGLYGRFLASGDVLPVGTTHAAGQEGRGPTTAPLEGRVHLHRGPHHGLLREPAALTETAWCLDPRSDRTGLCLSGPPLATLDRDVGAPSMPMVPGAIQLPPDGTPIVLGPDHPVSGGYPVVAVVAGRDLEALFTCPLGHVVRLTLDE